MRPTVIALALAASALASCGDEEPAPTVPAPAVTAQAACDYVAARGTCLAYSDAAAVAVADARWECAACGGIFGTSCPGDGRVGACLIPTPQYLLEMSFYAPSYGPGSGQLVCGSGAWVAVDAPAEAPSPATVSCSKPWNASCVDTSGPMTPTLRTALERNCTADDAAVLLAAACPRADRVGTCTTRPGALVWETRYYAASARPYCLDIGGTWTDG